MKKIIANSSISKKLKTDIIEFCIGIINSAIFTMDNPTGSVSLKKIKFSSTKFTGSAFVKGTCDISYIPGIITNPSTHKKTSKVVGLSKIPKVIECLLQKKYNTMQHFANTLITILLLSDLNAKDVAILIRATHNFSNGKEINEINTKYSGIFVTENKKRLEFLSLLN